MSFFEAIILGFIQGVTEFFPISSSGHLIIFEQLLGIETDYGVFLNVLLHIGTLSAVILAFRKEIKRLIFSFFGIIHDIIRNIHIFNLKLIKKQDLKYKSLLRTTNRRLLVYIFLANIPTILLGRILYGLVSGQSITLFIVGFALFVTGLLLFIVELAIRSSKQDNTLSWKNALLIGVFQGFAVIPGISRLGITLSVGLFCGLSKKLAIKYSFLISIPTIICATVFELFQLPSVEVPLTFGFIICSLFGAVTAFIVGICAIKLVLWMLKNSRLRYFAVYCFIVGIISIILNYTM